jgi:hypothetical protein
MLHTTNEFKHRSATFFFISAPQKANYPILTHQYEQRSEVCCLAIAALVFSFLLSCSSMLLFSYNLILSQSALIGHLETVLLSRTPCPKRIIPFNLVNPLIGPNNSVSQNFVFKSVGKLFKCRVV